MILQALMAQFGGEIVMVYKDGLTLTQWAFCLAIGFGSLPWQLIINVIKHLTAADVKTTLDHQGNPTSSSGLAGSGLKRLNSKSDNRLVPPDLRTRHSWRPHMPRVSVGKKAAAVSPAPE